MFFLSKNLTKQKWLEPKVLVVKDKLSHVSDPAVLTQLKPGIGF